MVQHPASSLSSSSSSLSSVKTCNSSEDYCPIDFKLGMQLPYDGGDKLSEISLNICSLCLTWGLMGENILNAYNLKTVADKDVVTVIH